MSYLKQASLFLLCNVAFLCASLSEGAPISTYRWCVISTDELSLCTRLVARFQALGSKNKTWTCVQKEGNPGCLEAIGTNTADFGSFDGTPIYDGADKWGLIPIVKEDLRTGDNYYAVAVMRRDKVNDKFKLSDLKGKKSCHTGYRRSAGWTVPLGHLAGNKIMEVVNEKPAVANDIESAQKFFETTCAPGASPTERVCTGCPTGDPCDATSNYWDYAGAFRCLVEGFGDVAFTKHSVPVDYSQGAIKADPSWKNLGTSDQYALVCPGGGFKPVTAAKDCHIATAPAHAMMTRSNLDPEDIAEFKAVMGNATTDSTVKDLVFAAKNTAGLMFHADATSFSALPAGTTAASYLGEFNSALQNFRAIESAPATGGAEAVPRSVFLMTTLLLAAVYFC